MKDANFSALRHLRTGFFLFIASLALAGCAGINYAVEHYGDVGFVAWKHDNKTWRIFDKPYEERMMVTASVGDAMAQGLVEGITLGVVDADHPGNVYRNVARAWLKEQGRECEIKSVSLIISPQWEIEYKCR